MKKIILRADGTPEIGLGHVYRMISLAHMLAGKFECYFVTNRIANIPSVEIDGLPIQFVEVAARRYTLPDNKKASDEIDFDLHGMISGDEIVITDGYWFGTNYQKEIKNKGCKLVCIDDLHNKEFFADLIINHAQGVKESDYKAQPYTRFALGVEYAILRPSFLKQARLKREVDSADTLLICFGGSDFLDLTISILKTALAAGFFKHISVVVGAGYTKYTSLQEAAQGHSHVTVHKNINEQALLKIMLQSDIAVVPASGILYETLAAGCKTLTGFYASNQRDIYDGFVANNSVFGCNDFSAFANDLDHFMQIKNDFKPFKLIDGLSGKRIAEAISEL